MSSQELETAVRLKLNLVVNILKDGSYLMIKSAQERFGLDNFGLDFGNPISLSMREITTQMDLELIRQKI